MKRLLDRMVAVSIVALFVIMVGGCVAYGKQRYHRKYPNTTTVDWLLDGNK